MISMLVSHWQFSSVSLIAVLASVVYQTGFRRQERTVRGGDAGSHRIRLRQAWTFHAAMLLVVVALTSPLAYGAWHYFSLQMVQELLLLVVVAPLVTLAAPWLTLSRGLPLRVRRGLSSRSWSAVPPVVVRVQRWAAGAYGAMVLFCLSTWVWFQPHLYEVAQSSRLLQSLEHVSLLAVGLLFWTRVVDSPPFRAVASHLQRVVVLFTVATSNWILAVMLGYSSRPLAGTVASHIGGLTGIEDQQIAAAIMWIPGMVPIGIAAFRALMAWLDHQDDQDAALEALIARERRAMMASGVVFQSTEAGRDGAADTGDAGPNGLRG